MPNRISKRQLTTTAAGLVALSAWTLVTIPAFAEEDELTFEQRIIHGILGGNSRPDIDYRERSPLVIPPSRDLPSPETTASIERTPAWPQDPDAAARRKEGSAKNKPAIDVYRESGRNLTPEELRRGGSAARGRASGPAATLSDNEMSRPLRPSEMGDNRSLFGLFGTSASAKPEVFAGEPSRSRLTEPPNGYRTPSASQPYAPPKDSGSWFKLPDVFDRGLSKDR